MQVSGCLFLRFPSTNFCVRIRAIHASMRYKSMCGLCLHLRPCCLVEQGVRLVECWSRSRGAVQGFECVWLGTSSGCDLWLAVIMEVLIFYYYCDPNLPTNSPFIISSLSPPRDVIFFKGVVKFLRAIFRQRRLERHNNFISLFVLRLNQTYSTRFLKKRKISHGGELVLYQFWLKNFGACGELLYIFNWQTASAAPIFYWVKNIAQTNPFNF